MGEKIVQCSSLEMYIKDQCKYAIIVDRRRAFPESRDGLKIVQRRILYAAYDQKMVGYNHRAKTSALTGELQKLYHPHGSAFTSIVSMVQWFKNKIPLMGGKGNWGAADGSGAAAERYVECYVSDFGFDVMLKDLAESDNTVKWIDIYLRNGIKEPEYLPAKLPILLINGTEGIGVGLAVDIPTHNLGEVVDATLALLRNPKSNVVLIPDHCQSCEIIDTDWKKICNTGNGSYKVRGKIVTEQDKKGNYILHIVSLPNGVGTSQVYSKIIELAENKQLPMVKDVYDNLKDRKPDVIIKLAPGVDPEYVKQILYAKTPVQRTENVNFEIVKPNGIDVGRMNYKEYLLSFLEQRMMVKFRMYSNKLQKAITRHHYLDAFIKVMDSGQIDKIINMIKKSNRDDAYIIEWIIKHCGTTDIQANYIINSNLKKLSLKRLKGYKEEKKALEANMKAWIPIVSDDGTLIRNEIEQELIELKKKYNTPRLCNVISQAEGNNIPAGVFKVVITEKNFIRKVPDVDKINIVKKDNPKFILRVDNTENILIFDNLGKVFNLPVSKIPITEKSGAGMNISILIKNLTSDIVAVFYEPTIKQIFKSKKKYQFVVLNKENIVKKIDIEDFLKVSPSGLIYTKVKGSDQVVSVQLAPVNLDVVFCSNKKALRCKLADIPTLKRNSQGVKAMDTNEPLEGMSIIYPDSEYIVVITKNGKFNKFNIGILTQHARARKGVNVIKLDSNDDIFGIYAVNQKDKIHVLSSEGVIEIPVAELKEKSNIVKGEKKIPNKAIIVKADIVR